LVGGSIWHSIGGFRNAPKGKGFSQAFSRVKARAPILGGSFAIWGTFFSIFDCSIAAIRKKEDPYNAIISGAATGGLLALRGGLKAAGTNALAGGLILAAIEGLNIGVQRVIMPMFEKSQQEAAEAAGMQVKVDLLDPPTDPLRHFYTAPSTSRSSTPSTPNLFGSTSTTDGSVDYAASIDNPNGNTSAIGGFDMDSADSFESQGLTGGMGGAATNLNGISAADSKDYNSTTQQSSSGWFKW
jgi:mitochondrial import inner membrane translocase subunit TIM17